MDSQNTTTPPNTQPPPVTPPPVNQPPPPQLTPAPVYVVSPPQSGTPDDTKTIVTVLLLIFAYPIGFLLMWFWTRWKVWVKLLISAPGCLIFIVFLGFFAVGFLAALNPSGSLQRAKCANLCQNLTTNEEKVNCMEKCTAPTEASPSSSGE